MRKNAVRLAVASLALTSFTTLASAQTGSIALDPQANISKANGNSSGLNGNVPVGIALAPGTNRVLQLLATGTWTCDLNLSGTYSADGFSSSSSFCVGPATILSSGSISGLVTPGRSMTLSALFLSAALPASAPANYDYSASGAFNNSTYSGIQNGQIFFVGDGQTGDRLGAAAGSGGLQSFLVPDDAAFLYFGVADACGFNGSPDCYSDNSGTINIEYDITSQAVVVTPEPSAYALMGAGLLVVAFSARRRRRV